MGEARGAPHPPPCPGYLTVPITPGGTTMPAAPRRDALPQNVLYILFDDLRADFGGASTPPHAPFLSSLAHEGTSFELAFSQVAFCVPSRASFLTGIRPERTRSIHNDQALRFGATRHAPLKPGFTVFDAFKRAGFVTAAVGKIFHFGEIHPSLDMPPLPSTLDLLGRPCDRPNATDVRQPVAHMRFGYPKACQLPFGSFVDERIAAAAIGYLRRLLGMTRPVQEDDPWRRPPFFLAVGFCRPHNPYHFPSRHLDRLPAANQTDIAAVRWRHESQPSIAYADSSPCSLRKCSREQRRFYRAAVSHVDEMVGLVLRELRQRSVDKSTLVVAHADHGFSMGENGAWQKRSNFDHASRVPLIIRDPRLPRAAGVVVQAPVELTDVLPTLLDLSGAASVVSPPRHLQGRSLRPLLVPSALGGNATAAASFTHAFMLQPRLLYLSRDNASRTPRRHTARQRVALVDGGANVSAVLSDGEVPRPKDCSTELLAGGFGPGRSCRFVAMGFSVRSRQWRYTRWERWPVQGGSTRVWTVGEGQLLAEELYSYSSDGVGASEQLLQGYGAEEINLAAPWSRQRLDATQLSTVRVAKQSLMQALLTRRATPLPSASMSLGPEDS
jgi:iduronate 2-sulfatase